MTKASKTAQKKSELKTPQKPTVTDRKNKLIRHPESNPYGIDLVRKDGRPLRILQVIPTLNLGGAEQSCIDVAHAIQLAGGHSIVVSNGGSREHEAERWGGRHIKLPVHRKNPFVIWKNSIKLRKIIEHYEIDVVHARSRAPGWAAHIAAEKAGVPFMTTFHAAYKFKSKLKRKYNSVMSKGERIISISQFISKHIVDNYGIDKKKLRVAYRGLSLEKFHPNSVSPERMIQLAKKWQLPEDKAILLMPARMTRIKGHEAVIEALALLKNPNVMCVMVGKSDDNNPYYQGLLKLIKERNLEENVKIVDKTMDMPAAYSLATCVISTSGVPEGFGRVPVEAQAMGKPVIASNIGATIETIQHGKTGFLVPPNNAAEISKAIHKILCMSREEINQMGTRAMNNVSEQFSLNDMLKVVLKTYLELANQKKKGKNGKTS